MKKLKMFALVVAGVTIFVSAFGAAEDQDMPGVAPEPAGGWKTKAICISVPAPKDVGRFCTFVKDTLKPAGVDTVVLLVRYKFQFTSHPGCVTKDAISLDDAKAIKRACDDAGIRLIPKMNLLGHQSGNTISDGLLKAYPELDESPEKKNVRNNYCRSICPKHPDSMRIVTDLADELVEAFGADALHIGCDEVFEIGNCPRCKDTPTSKLFADWVNGIARHLKSRGVDTMIWGDRLLDAKTTGYGEWEASDNGTSDAVNMLDKDIAICDWHYENCPAYPSVDVFADAGRKIYLCPWRYSENTQKFLAYAVAHDRGQYLGLIFTTWSSCKDVMDVLEGKGVPRHEPGSKAEKTLLSLRRNFRYLFPKAKSVTAEEPATRVDTTARPEKWAVPMTCGGVPNLHKVSDKLYRSAQPTAEGMTNLVALGIKTVVNLRDNHSDSDEIGGLPLKARRIEIFTGNMKDKYVTDFLSVLDDTNAVPVLVHCQHGADRTGTMCAMYRILREGWTADEAIAEMKNGGYGYHSVWGNLPRFIRKASERMKQPENVGRSGVGEGVDAVKWKGPDVLTAISTRKSIRKFDASKPVEDDKVEKMLRAAMCAPTAMDKRPWEFVVVKDPAKLSALATRLPYSRVGNGAKLAIVVCGSLDNGLPGRGKEYWIHDCSAATMNLLLAAHAQGLGAVWTGVFPGEDRIAAVREILSIPDGYMPLNVIPVGYPAENPPAKDKWNPAKIHYDKW